MALTLNKIELFNFRSHEHFVFEPDQKGITAISGRNGTGKSTIVDGFAWAMYGTRPSKVTNRLLIRDGCDPKVDRVEVIVYLTINKIEYKVSRRILATSGQVDCNVYGRPAGATDFNILAGPAVSSSEAYIKQIMGMDEKGFLTSILIQQKQVDQIVSASARERAEVIEKLTGISSITQAIDIARGEMKAYQRAAGVITVKDSEAIKNDIKDVMSRAKEKKQIGVANTKKQKELQQKNDTLSTRLEQETDNYNRSEELKNKQALIKQKEKMLNQELNRLLEELTSFKKDNDSTMIIPDPAPLKKESDSALSTYLRAKNEIERLANELDSDRALVHANSSLVRSKPSVQASIADLSTQETELTSLLEKLTEEKQVINVNEKQSKKALTTVSSGTGVCPTCKRPFDNPDDLIEELNRELKELKDKKAENKQVLSAKQAELASCQSELADQQATLEKIESIETLSGEIAGREADLSAKQTKTLEFQSRSETLQKQYSIAIRDYSRREEIENKKARVTAINSELGSVHSEQENLSTQVEGIHALMKSELNALRREAGETQKELNALTIQLNQDRTEYSYLQTRYNELKEQYNDAVKAQKKYNELTDDMKRASVANNVMAQFKIDRIQFAVPTIEMYASTILSQFTDGKFIQLKLDGKFNTTVVTADGEERPIAQLSGGELSAAAIALRLSISMLLNGSEKNVIIFDEVLVSMDEQRARKIMETISTVTNSQIIFIAHNGDIDSIADLVVTVGQDSDEGENF